MIKRDNYLSSGIIRSILVTLLYVTIISLIDIPNSIYIPDDIFLYTTIGVFCSSLFFTN